MTKTATSRNQVWCVLSEATSDLMGYATPIRHRDAAGVDFATPGTPAWRPPDC